MIDDGGANAAAGDAASSESKAAQASFMVLRVVLVWRLLFIYATSTTLRRSELRGKEQPTLNRARVSESSNRCDIYLYVHYLINH